jgi:hypothetical protein
MKKSLFIIIFLLAFGQMYGRMTVPELYDLNSGIEFIENAGQFTYPDGSVASDVLFKAKISEGEIYVRRSGIAFVLKKPLKPVSIKQGNDRMASIDTPESIKWEYCKTEMVFAGANAMAKVKASEPLDSYTNYYIEDKEYTDVRSYRKIIIENVYDDIDFAIYSNENGEPEYDFIVHPGADPSAIALEFRDYDGISIADNNLLIVNRLGKIEHREVMSYQQSRTIASKFIINADNTVSFAVDNYDRAKNLTIDPVIKVWSLGFSGRHNDFVVDIKLDSEGNIYLAGYTLSNDLVVLNAFQPDFASQYGGGEDGTLAKYDKNGKMLWATYVGGERPDFTSSLAIDSKNNLIYAGWTWSHHFHTTKFFKDLPSDEYSSGFILKISDKGKLLWGTYTPSSGGDYLYDVLVDKNDNIYSVGTTFNEEFYNSFNNKKRQWKDAFVLKLNTDCEFQWSRIIQGDRTDKLMTVALDSLGNLYAAGETYSNRLEGISIHRNDTIFSDLFYCRLDTSGRLYWTKILAGNGTDRPADIQINSKNEIIIVGKSLSDDITLNGFQTHLDFKGDGIVLYVNGYGKITWGTFISAPNDSFERIFAAAVDRFDNVYLSGFFSGILNYQKKPDNPSFHDYDLTIIKLNDSKEIEWYTYFGEAGWDFAKAIAVNRQDDIYIGYETYSYYFSG